MRTIKLFLAACIALAMVACSKEQKPDQFVVNKDGKIIFSVKMNLDESYTKASLSGLNINWTAGDQVAIANNINDEIEAVTVSGVSGQNASLAVTAVDGATSYYAFFPYSASLSFDHTTSTFAGASVSNNAFGAGSLTDATQLSMAGKSSGSSISLKPCLTLIKFQMAAASVAAKYDGGYSGVRAVRFTYTGGQNASGEYNVTIGGSGSLSVESDDDVVTGDHYRIAGNASELLASGTQYYMAVLHGWEGYGRIEFLGFNSSSAPIDTPVYSMTTGTGKYFNASTAYDFGTLDPVGLKKAADALAPSTTTITLDLAKFPTSSGDGNIVEGGITFTQHNLLQDGTSVKARYSGGPAYIFNATVMKTIKQIKISGSTDFSTAQYTVYASSSDDHPGSGDTTIPNPDWSSSSGIWDFTGGTYKYFTISHASTITWSTHFDQIEITYFD